MQKPFIRAAFFYGKGKGWLVETGRIVDPVELLEPGLGQYEGWNYQLSEAGKKYFGRSK